MNLSEPHHIASHRRVPRSTKLLVAGVRSLYDAVPKVAFLRQCPLGLLALMSVSQSVSQSY